jgi:hypothetical protein
MPSSLTKDEFSSTGLIFVGNKRSQAKYLAQVARFSDEIVLCWWQNQVSGVLAPRNAFANRPANLFVYVDLGNCRTLRLLVQHICSWFPDTAANSRGAGSAAPAMRRGRLRGGLKGVAIRGGDALPFNGEA